MISSYAQLAFILSNRHGVSAAYSFDCKDQKGAIVVPGDYASLRLVRRNDRFFDYVRQHHKSWFEFARSLGLDVKPEDIILVSGWLKTTEWAVAAVLAEGKAHAFSLNVDPGSSIVQARLDIEHSTNHKLSTSHRKGPNKITARRRDQCLFLRYYKAKYRFARFKFLGMKIVAAAEPQPDDPHHDSEGSAAGTRSICICCWLATAKTPRPLLTKA